MCSAPHSQCAACPRKIKMMELVRGLHNLRPEHRGCAVTIGNFDGVHLGHQAVLRQLAARAKVLGVPTLVMLFEPQPREFFDAETAPPRLTRLREKLAALRTQPVDRVLCVRFDAHFAAVTAEDFIQRVLLQNLGVRYVVVGQDFRYGNKRRGDIELLKRAGREHGFEVATAATFAVDGERVSSTRVRTALIQGDLKTAESLLGRPYQMCGRVVHGEKIGRRIGVPTANIRLHRARVPIGGIFVVEMSDADGARLPAVASVGIRPTIGGTEPLLEVHLLDIDRDVYGQYVTVDFLQRLRDERRFASLEEMRPHILRDIDAARQYFSARRASVPSIAAGASHP
jgi:riboflavin kinase / FMN adenylyltransferase